MSLRSVRAGTGALVATIALLLAAAPASAGFNPDLALDIAAAPNPVAPGAPLTYTISVDNPFPGSSFDVALQTAVPAGSTFTSFVAPAGWVANTPAVGATGPITATLAQSQPGEDFVFTLVVAVDPGAVAGQAIVATASVTAQAEDPGALGNNSDTVTVAVATGPASTTSTTATTATTAPPLATTTTAVLARTGRADGGTAAAGVALLLGGAAVVLVAGGARRRARSA